MLRSGLALGGSWRPCEAAAIRKTWWASVAGVDGRRFHAFGARHAAQGRGLWALRGIWRMGILGHKNLDFSASGAASSTRIGCPGSFRAGGSSTRRNVGCATGSVSGKIENKQARQAASEKKLTSAQK